MIKKLWQVLLQSALETDPYQINCIECFNLLDQYADLLLAGADPQEIMPTVKEHLNHCPTCTYEFETLLLMIQSAAQNQETAPS